MQDLLLSAGFSDIKIEVKENAAEIIKDWMPGSGAEQYITSAYVTARKGEDSFAAGFDLKPSSKCFANGKDVTPAPKKTSCCPPAKAERPSENSCKPTTSAPAPAAVPGPVAIVEGKARAAGC
mmetsp:Transcript_35340/g.77276  ORF Transcript_35340/g.77276 Transcript_35340/m.77276 type:complete len:123 (-) Transcript_35340:77-445(-)